MGRLPTFSPEDDAQLQARFERGLSRPEIAFVVGRSVKAVAWRMECLGLSIVERNRALKHELAAARAVVRQAWERRRARSAVRKAMVASEGASEGASDAALVLASGAQGVTTKRAALPASVRSDCGQSTPLPLRGRAKHEGLTGQNQTEPSPLALRAAQPAPKPFPTSFPAIPAIPPLVLTWGPTQ